MGFTIKLASLLGLWAVIASPVIAQINIPRIPRSTPFPRPTIYPRPIPLSGSPDLIIENFNVGTPRRSGQRIEIPVTVTVKNRGQASANRFKLAIDYTAEDREFVGSFKVPGESNMWYPFTDSELAAGESKTFRGTFIFNNRRGISSTDLTAKADSCSGDEFMPGYCRVQESSETNNTRTVSGISLR
ncbi:CARDB domain-containing protein [Aerosakkonemataceae cyanobacterium BLCC-F154]|uniref:CARDB domain-containing protein n=1 Tax=Floridaenema fluviatile BLCC-F154 TaxID=3153640 RepID=A0ABV4YB10_9CYAN